MKTKDFTPFEMKIAAPCHEKWEDMTGDNQVRFCQRCQLNVYNFADMAPAEIESIVKNHEGRLCGRLYVRPDNTVMLQNCPVGLKALRHKLISLGALAASLLFTLLLPFGVQAKPPYNCIEPSETPPPAEQQNSPQRTLGKIAIPKNPSPSPQPVEMGEIAAPSPPPEPPSP